MCPPGPPVAFAARVVPEAFLGLLVATWPAQGSPVLARRILILQRWNASVTESNHHTQQVERHRDGSATLSFRVDGLDEIIWWLLGWSGFAKVIRPDALRERFLEQLQAGINSCRQVSI
jgi:predicted DNA-binding transcriptional regulator YafY